MKKTMMVLVLIVTAVFMPCRSFAKDIAGRIGVGGNWFYYMQNDADFEGEDLDIKGTPEAFNMHVSYCLPRPNERINVNLIFDWEYISREIELEHGYGLSDELGTATLIPFMVGAQVRLTDLGPVTPYVGFALGISFNSIDEGDRFNDWERSMRIMNPGWDFDADIEVDNSFAFKIPIGVDVFLNDNIAFNLEAKYFYTAPNVEITEESFNGYYYDTYDDHVDMSTFAVGMGLSFYF